MPTKNINISIDEQVLLQSDALIASGKYANRSRFIEESIVMMLKRIDEEEIGEQAKLLTEKDSEEWYEGELESWQEKY
jgi:Arc/MetJ-type ribon-helix-helix transcriptional regulator